jgi:hypothetical protein
VPGGSWTKLSHTEEVDNDRLATNAFAALLVIAFYYLSYRYPLRINSSTTSPTYSDTPGWLQVGKYFLIGIVLAATAMGVTTRQLSRPKRTGASYTLTGYGLILISVFALVKGSLFGSTDMIVVGLVILPGAFLTSMASRWKLDSVRLANYVLLYAVISVIAEAIQVLLFRTQGRLPALAYGNSTSIRFGSVLDDPNGFAILVALLLPVVWVTCARSWPRRLVLSASLVIALVLSQSFTGVASVVIAFLIGYLGLKWKSQTRVVALYWMTLLLATVTWVVFVSNSDFFARLLSERNGSIVNHGDSLDKLFGVTASSLMGIGSPGAPVESSYVNLLDNFGLLFTLVYLLIGIVAIRRLGQTIAQSQYSANLALDYGFFFYLIAYLIGSVNLPLDRVFPANLLYALGIVFSIFSPMRSSGLAELAEPDSS